MQSVDLDEIDRKILQELQEHGRIPNVELADRVGLSPAPCLRRVRALEAAGGHPPVRGAGRSSGGRPRRHRVRAGDAQSAGRRSPRHFRGGDSPATRGAGLLHDGWRVRLPAQGRRSRRRRLHERFLKESLTHIENVASFKSAFALKEAKYSTVLPLFPSAPRARSSRTPLVAVARRRFGTSKR